MNRFISCEIMGRLQHELFRWSGLLDILTKTGLGILITPHTVKINKTANERAR